ncbi:MAG: phosphatidylglycerol lysyltransferase domain-containing protein [Elusimicrobiales bacterium]|nr:phosphatidylglycerol lysyltransferase domain-containing protein [Elusimicrobiales bacterium]
MFNRLKPEDYPVIKKFFDKHRYALCEYSPATIIVWNRCLYEVTWKQEGDLLLVAETDLEPPAAKRLLMPLPHPFRDVPPAELADIARRNRHTRYYYVPQDYYERHQAGLDELFTAQEQPGYMDYLYRAHDMAALAGHKYSKKRNLIAQFCKQTAAARKVKVEPLTHRNNGACLSLLDRWAHDPEVGARLDMLNCERKAIVTGLKHFDLLEMKGVLVKIDGEISGFAFGSRLSDGVFVLNFEKALEDVKGLYQFLDNELARHLPPQYSFINKESDLCKPGLAKAKESYYPAFKIKSFMLTLKS